MAGVITTSARLLRLLSLLQARPVWAGAELAERLEVTGRSLRRDVDRLRELGYPVHADRGVGGGYRLGAGRELPPLLLDDDEAVTVAVALQSAAAVPGSAAGSGETALRALGKLERVLPARLRRQVAALAHATVYTRRRPVDPVDSAALTVLARSCRDLERVRFDYVSRGGAASRRHVEPLRMVSTGARWYLAAYDVERRDWRTFRIDRLTDPRTTGARFRRAETPDAAALVARSVGATVYPCQARLRLGLSTERAHELIGGASGLIERETARSCVFTSGARAWRDIAVWMLHLGCPVTILEPDELRVAAREVAAELTRAAGA